MPDEPPRHTVESVTGLDVNVGTDGARDQVASTNGCAAASASPASAAANTDAGEAPPSGRHDRCPATSRHHATAASASARATRIPFPAKRNHAHTASAARRAAYPWACAPGPGRPASRSARPSRHRTVDLRVIQIGLVHPGAQIIGHQPSRHTAEERERLHVRLGPGVLIHPQHRAHEHIREKASTITNAQIRRRGHRPDQSRSPDSRNRSGPPARAGGLTQHVTLARWPPRADSPPHSVSATPSDAARPCSSHNRCQIVCFGDPRGQHRHE